MNNKRALTR